MDNLRNDGLIVPNWCCLCKRSGKSVDHLLLHCSVARELWCMVFGVFGMQWVMPATVLGHFSGWPVHLGQQRNLTVWQLVGYCVLWCLWRERNAHHFEDKERTLPKIKLLFFHTLFEWVVGLGNCSTTPLWS